MKHVVITGGTGFVGRHLIAKLRARGWRVTVPSRNRQAHRELTVMPDVRVVSCDVHDKDALARLMAGADAVVNLVGILNESGFDGAGFRRAHVEFTRQVIAAMRAAGVPRLVQMSALNSGLGQSHYLKSRCEADAFVREGAVRWTIVQPSVIFGPGDGLFFRFAQLLRLPAPVMPLARAGTRFAPVYVEDVAEAIARCLDDDATVGRTYQLFGPRVMTLAEIVRYTRDLLGLSRWVVGLPDALGALQAAVLGLVPGKPFSLDNYRSLALDSVGTQSGLEALGIAPTDIDTVMPRLLRGEDKQAELDRYRARRRSR